MSVGVQLNSSQIDTNITILANSLRKVMEQINDYQKQINGLGSAGLETSGYNSADAATVQQIMGYFATIVGVYYGTATQGTDFDFDNAFSQLWGGQVQ